MNEKISRDYSILIMKLLHMCKSSNLSSAQQLVALMYVHKKINDNFLKEIKSSLNN